MTSFVDEIKEWPEYWRDRWGEGAAVLEHDQGNTRAKADYLSYRAVKKEMDRDQQSASN